MSAVDASTTTEVAELEPLSQRIMVNVRSGNLGSAPVALALAIVVFIFAPYVTTTLVGDPVAGRHPGERRTGRVHPLALP